MSKMNLIFCPLGGSGQIGGNMVYMLMAMKKIKMDHS